MEIFESLQVEENRSRLCYLLTEYAKEIINGHGLHVGLIKESFPQSKLDQMTDSEKLALTFRKEAYFYDLFLEYDKMYQYLAKKKLVKTSGIPYPEMPLEFLRLMLKTVLSRQEFRKVDENMIHSLYNNIGEGLYLYYQGLLYEYYCDTSNKEVKDRLDLSVRRLLKAYNEGNSGFYLFDSEGIDFDIATNLHETIEKADISDKYCKRMEHTLTVLEGLE